MVIDESTYSQEQIDRTDAKSRVILSFVEALSKPDVARYGDISFDAKERRAISPTGHLAMKATPMGIETLEITEEIPLRDSIVGAHVRYMNPDGSYQKLPVLKMTEPRSAFDMMQSACDASYIPMYYDYRPLAQKLGLLEKDYDQLRPKDGPIVRVADDQRIWDCFPPGLNLMLMQMYDSQHQLLEDNVGYKDGQVYTVKIFKFIGSPGIFWLPFRRCTPGVVFPCGQCSSGYLDTDYKTVSVNRGMTWLNDAGDLSKMDWEVLRGRAPALVWHAKQNQFEANASLRHILSIVASAKKKDLTLDVIKASCIDGKGEEASEVKRLNLAELRLEAQRRKIDLPEELKDSVFLLDLDSVIDTSKLPPYWNDGAVIGFTPAPAVKRAQVLQKLVAEMSENQILVLARRKDFWEVRNAVGEHASGSPYCADIDVLKQPVELGRIVHDHGIELILLLFETDSNKDIHTALVSNIGVCVELSMPVGVLLSNDRLEAKSFVGHCDGMYYLVQKEAGVVFEKKERHDSL